MVRKIALAITSVFSPILIPAYLTLVLLYSEFHFSMFSWNYKRFLLLVMVISTLVMPALTLLVSSFGKNFRTAAQVPADNRIAMLFVALYYYLGYFLLNKMPQYAIFKILLLAGAILIVIITLFSIWQDISRHGAAAGAAFGMMLALALRIGINPLGILTAMVLLAGLTGTALMILNKHSLSALIGGYLIGFLVFFLIFFLL
jgi:hypothetical protein